MRIKKIYSTVLILFCSSLFIGWGGVGHKIINRNATLSFPQEMSHFQYWGDFLASYSSEADYRKNSNEDEAPKHYIDIDNYPEFVTSGRISSDFDSLVAKYGYSFVLDQGILPWAILATFDSLQVAFEKRHWQKAKLFAADLGHYIGDGHMPLHITRNFNGQFTNQFGIHSRYESGMLQRFSEQIVYEGENAKYVTNISDYIFNFIYFNYSYVDSVLEADEVATRSAGSIENEAYYSKLWGLSNSFTILLLKNASYNLATLMYTAWINAGSPIPDIIDTDIYAIQQDQTLIGEMVSVTGIVTVATGIFHPGKTFIEAPNGGPWSGVALWDEGAVFKANEGDAVKITGDVIDYYGMTEIQVGSYEILSTGNPLPPVISVKTGDIATGSPTAQSYEGVLVRVSDVVVIDNALGYGEWSVSDGTGDCRIDDDADSLVYEMPANGTSFASITGVLNYSYDKYKLEPRYLSDLKKSNNAVHSSAASLNPVLYQNSPNPFNSETVIEYQLPQISNVELIVYNLRGLELFRSIPRTRIAGTHRVSWDGRDSAGSSVASGIYFYRLRIIPLDLRQPVYSEQRKMILLK